ncbi:hypothetical protein PV779_46290 [Streptomyces sp. ID01-9D]|nr:hypothetical protein [Streptomyces sp. ID01-9D]
MAVRWTGRGTAPGSFPGPSPAPAPDRPRAGRPHQRGDRLRAEHGLRDLPAGPGGDDLLGRAAWWIPGPLDRILPHLDAEGGAEAGAETRAEPAGPAGKK